MRRWWAALAVGLGAAVLAGLGYAGARRWEASRLEAALGEAAREMAAGRFATARRQLAGLAERWPEDGEVNYRLGLCEQARGRGEAALAAWGRVPDSSPFAGRAEVGKARVAMDRGRLAEAETLLGRALASPGPHSGEARWGLVLLLRQQGRLDEARRLFVEGIDPARDPVAALRDLFKLDHDPFPTEGVGRAMEAFGRRSPDDDRVWLARANLATRLGRFGEADRWLVACQARRPDDPAVWRARLEWAVAADRPDAARQALPHVPAGLDPEAEALTLRAWFAAHDGDPAAERAALERLTRLDPGNTRALDRLAELAATSRRLDDAARLRRRRIELEQADKDYTALLSSRDTASKAADLARLAGILGRRVDREIWSRIASRPATPHPSPLPQGERGPDPAVANSPLSPRGRGAGGEGVGASDRPIARGTTLADLLADVVGIRPAGTRPLAEPRPPETLPRFTDDAPAAGLDFVHENGGDPARLTPPVATSGGVGLLDYDGDGRLDVYCVQGGPFPGGPASPRDGDCLYRNRGDGTFEDVSERAGVAGAVRGYGHGVAVGDIDNDGRPDMLLTRWRSYLLLHNKGDGTFEDATARAGLSGDRDWPTSAAFADLDNDGDLDLYVCHYLVWSETDHPPCVDPADPSIYHCMPREFPALPDHVFRNDGGRFVDVTESAGIVDRDGRGMGVVAADLDDDGRVDLYVANDTTANYLFRNLGGFRFAETALDAGAAASAGGGFQAGMGIACGDLDGDGRPDLAVTNFYNESTTFFRNLGHGLFGDHTTAVGLAAPTRYLMGWGIAFLDADNDGRLDVLTANGHSYDGRPQFPFAMPIQLLLGGLDGRLTDVSHEAGPAFETHHLGRGLAAGDLDNDGRVDALIVAQNEPLVFLHNRTEAGHSVTFRLEGTTSNRDAVGARVEVLAGGRRQVARRVGGGSFQSAGDPRLRFGLGAATRVESVEVKWPSGRVDRHRDLAADAAYLLREGSPPAPPPGWKR